jgi:hypothetical protein
MVSLLSVLRNIGLKRFVLCGQSRKKLYASLYSAYIFKIKDVKVEVLVI